MSLKYGLLGLLSYEDMTGYELDKTFKDSLSFFWQAQTSQIYRELNAMEKLHWLSSRIEVQKDKPNRRVYSITETGKEALRCWLHTDLPLGFYPSRSETLMRIFFSAQNDISNTIEALKKLENAYCEQIQRIKMLNEIINRYQSKAHSEMDLVFWRLTGNFGLEYCEMCLRWIRNSTEELKLIKENGVLSPLEF